MKYFLLLLLIHTATFAFDYHLKPKKVTESIYCFFGELAKIAKENGGNVVNSCYVKTKKGFIVIDSGPTSAYAKQAYDAMQKIAKLPVKYVINTHDHDDHWLGNSFYKSKGAVLIGSQTYQENVTSKMQTRMLRILGKELFGQTKLIKLDKVVEEKLTLTVDGEKFEISQPISMAHTQGDLVVYLPSQKAIFVGDLVFNGRVTSLRDGSILGSLEVLDVIDNYYAKTIITGHGYQTDENTTHEFRSYLTQIKEQVLEAQDHDVGIEQITQKVKVPNFEKLKLYDELYKRTVLDVYKELEMMEDEEDDE